MALIPLRLPGGGVSPLGNTGIADIVPAFQETRRGIQRGQFLDEQLQDFTEGRERRGRIQAGASGIDPNLFQTDPAAAIAQLAQINLREGDIGQGSNLLGQSTNIRTANRRLDLAERADRRAATSAATTATDRRTRKEGLANWARENRPDLLPFVGTGLVAAAAKETIKPTMTPFQQRTIELAEEKAAAKVAETEAEKAFAAQDNIDRARTVTRGVDEVLSLVQKSPGTVGTTTGKLGGFFPGSVRGQINAALGQIKGNLGFKNITDLKRAGVSLGALSDTERTVAENLDAALDPDLPDNVLMRNLETVRKLQQRIDPTIPDYVPPQQNVPLPEDVDALVNQYLGRIGG